MRNKNKAFLSCAIVAAIGLLARPGAMATGGTSCSSFNPTVTIVAGPCPVSGANPMSACASPLPGTGIKYRVTGSPDQLPPW